MIDPLANNGQGEWSLLSPLVFVDDYAQEWVVPVGFTTDFASVPRAPIGYALVGNTAHAPAVLHDWVIRHNATSREYADDLFRQAMHAIGMPKWRIAIMYQAVAGYTRQLLNRINPWSDQT